jgi:hypothetical protein
MQQAGAKQCIICLPRAPRLTHPAGVRDMGRQKLGNTGTMRSVTAHSHRHRGCIGLTTIRARKVCAAGCNGPRSRCDVMSRNGNSNQLPSSCWPRACGVGAHGSLIGISSVSAQAACQWPALPRPGCVGREPMVVGELMILHVRCGGAVVVCLSRMHDGSRSVPARRSLPALA